MKIERGVYRLADNFVIEMLHITKEFPGIKANDDVTLQLRKGEIHALLGENGAGKSTLMSVLFGKRRYQEKWQRGQDPEPQRRQRAWHRHGAPAFQAGRMFYRS